MNTAMVTEAAKSSLEFSSLRSGLDQATSVTLLRSARSVLDNSGVRFLLLFGTVLGAIRSGRFIDFDTDIDIGIAEDRRADVIADVNDLKYQRLGLGVFRENEFLISLEYGGHYLDAYFFKPELERYVCGQYSLTRSEWEQPEELLFLGETFLVPNNPTNYLVSKYGENWREPIVGKHAIS